MIALLAALLAVVNSPYAPPTYACNGIQATFVVAFPYRDQTDLVLTSSAVGVLALTTDYTVSLVSSTTTALVTLTNPAVRCPSGTLKITRVTRPPQKYAFGQQTKINTQMLETSSDAIVYQIQEAAEVAGTGSGGGTVSASTPLTGTGAAANPLDFDYSVAGSWSGAQSFKYINGTCKIGQFTGADFSAKMNAALADASCTGKIFDASDMTGNQTMSQDITVLASAVSVIFPPTEIAMGAHQVIVPVGKNSVKLSGASGSYGTNTGAAQLSTRFNYTGNAAAIVVGDSSANTMGFVAENMLIVTNFGGANAINMQLNRAVDYTISQVNFSFANTQWGLDLEGYVNYTGGTIIHPILSGISGDAIHFGKNANANTVIGAHIAMGNIAGICFNFDGGGSGSGGNTIVGGDCENATTALRMDFSTYNTSHGLRVENCTNVLDASANSGYSHFDTKGTQAMAVIGAGGTNNSITDTYFTQIGRAKWLMKNSTDTASNITLQAGLTADQAIEIYFQGFGGTDWRISKTAGDVFQVVHQQTGITRSQFQAANSLFNAEGAGGFYINTGANSGTGGLLVQSGGAVPVTSFQIAADGLMTMRAKAQAALGAPANGTFYYCNDCTVANPCAGGGTGALAKRLAGAWVCN